MGLRPSLAVAALAALAALAEPADPADAAAAAARRGLAMEPPTHGYLSLAGAYAYMRALSSRGGARVLRLGRSSEGRDVRALLVRGSGPPGGPLAVLVAGMHAREWAAPAVALAVLHRLLAPPAAARGPPDPAAAAAAAADGLAAAAASAGRRRRGAGAGAELAAAADGSEPELAALDWVVVPVLNPDGYEFARTRDPRWRKTRSRTAAPCLGADLNRNFPAHWGEGRGGADACSWVYPGAEPFSEPEARALGQLLKSVAGRLRLFVSLHGATPALVYPWAHKREAAPGARQMAAVAQAAAGQLCRTGGPRFEVGAASELLRPIFGTALDYAVGEARAAMGFALAVPVPQPPGRPPDAEAFFRPPAVLLPAAADRTVMVLRVLAHFSREEAPAAAAAADGDGHGDGPH